MVSLGVIGSERGGVASEADEECGASNGPSRDEWALLDDGVDARRGQHE